MQHPHGNQGLPHTEVVVADYDSVKPCNAEKYCEFHEQNTHTYRVSEVKESLP